MHFIDRLPSFLDKEQDRLFIQTHDFPDHDSVACAFALQEILLHLGYHSHLIYEGVIQRDSLKDMIRMLGIDICHNEKHQLKAHHKIIIVDGCKGNQNVTDLIGDEIALIDHHQVKQPEDVPLADIRPEVGACSSILESYYHHLGLEPSRERATALMIGINMDTSLLTRGVSKGDILSYSRLYSRADVTLQNSILRNYIQTRDLSFYRYALDHIVIKENLAWCYFPQGCNQNLLGILGDFFLSLQEVDLVVLCAKNEDKINFSLRNEDPQWNAAALIKKALKGQGFGGGHREMAGGIIPLAEDREFLWEEFFQDFYALATGRSMDKS